MRRRCLSDGEVSSLLGGCLFNAVVLNPRMDEYVDDVDTHDMVFAISNSIKVNFIPRLLKRTF